MWGCLDPVHVSIGSSGAAAIALWVVWVCDATCIANKNLGKDGGQVGGI